MYLIADEWTEPYHPQQNPAEMRAVKWLKEHTTQVLLDRQGAPATLWLQAARYLAHIHNLSADKSLQWAIPLTVRRGETVDISAYLQFQFYDKVYYLDPLEVYPNTQEKTGYWVGVADNVGDALTYEILTDDTIQITNRSVVRPVDPRHPNKCVTFDPALDPTVVTPLPLTSPLPPL